jgi:isopentenyl diphosphate isomerase/L-lactate dehydrogenase-like FMN-dependent dehydrogenase
MVSERSVGAMERPVSVVDVERLAETVLTPEAHAYIAGGAGAERTLRWNLEAFARARLRPRVLVDVGDVSTETTVLGTGIFLPVLLAPVAFQWLANPGEKELGTARAAAAAGTVMCLSTLATATPEEVADAAPDGARWYQVYVYRDRGVTEELVSRALAAGYSALVLTVDLPVVGIRERERAAGFSVPDEHVPAAQLARARGGEESDSLHLLDPTLDWAYLEDMCARSPVPVVVKGILTAEDAHLACMHGAAGVVVSNHGGRQLDGAVASLDALPEVVEAVGGRAEILLDGGVRRGTDVVTALALGARAVFVGRPAVYGLAWGGEDGVGRVLAILQYETANALALLGCRSPGEVSREHLATIASP